MRWYGMIKLRSFGRRLSLAGALLLSTPLLAGCAPRTLQVVEVEDHNLVVIGQGEVTARPDIARANLGIEIIAPTVGEATRQANERMAAIFAALRRIGIDEKDIRTSNFSVNFERNMPEPMGYPMPASPPSASPPQPPSPSPMMKPAPAPVPPPMPTAVPSGFYRVSNTVDVTIRDLSRVGPVLDAAMAAGANSIWGVNFGLDETDALAVKAREEAMADARKRAEALARLGGVALGEVISISEETGGGGGMPPPMPVMLAAMKDASAPTPIAPGEVRYGMQVRVVYAIEPR